MNSFTAIAAAVSSAANSNASAGIFNYNSPKNELNKSKLMINKKSQESPSEPCHVDSHQIGTNLADLSVCWHRVSMSDNCKSCGQPFYEANQFMCEKCNGTASSKLAEQTTNLNGDDIKADLIEKMTPANEKNFTSINSYLLSHFLSLNSHLSNPNPVEYNE